MEDKLVPENAEMLYLCRPCAETLAERSQFVEKVKLVAPHKKKGTCDHCTRRRYGYDCLVFYVEV